MKAFFLGFKYALSGLAYAIKSERNMRFHVLSALCVVLAAFFFKIQIIEWLFVFSAIISVLASELINTAIERVCDLYTKAANPLVKVAKDTAAAAVLLCAIYALIVGIAIFTKYVLNFFSF